MNAKAIIVLAALLAIATLPLGNASHPSTACDQTQAIHGYTGAGGAYAGIDVDVGLTLRGGWDEQEFDSGTAQAYDSCDQDLDGDGVPGDYDGDMESGYGGGRFVAGSDRNGCASLRGEVPHHGWGVGAQYWADEELGLNIAYRAGADGPALVQDPTAPAACVTDGVITDDPTTDPLDCGAGLWGHYIPGVMWTPATLAENVPGNGACDPWDTTVWVLVHAGVLAEVEQTGVWVLTPVSGHIWG